jgi:parallel beta-helix repeat protein
MSYQGFNFKFDRNLGVPQGGSAGMPQGMPHWGAIAQSLRVGSLVGVLGVVLSGVIPGQQGAIAQATPAPLQLAQIPAGAVLLYVNPVLGSDNATAGSTENAPFRTIAYALLQAKPGNVIQLARGSYSAQSGEVFPLTLPAGVTLRGEEAEKGQTVVIIGGGNYISPTFARQNVALRAVGNSDIRGIAVTNPNTRGTGIWVESANPTIQNCTFKDSNRDGIFVTGTSVPRILDNTFIRNGGQGMSVANNAKGEIRGNLFQENGFGLAIGDNAQPSVTGNTIIRNTDGIYLNGAARPILRNNTISSNQRDGIVVSTRAQPDLGTAESPGSNTLQANGQYDLNNSTEAVVYSFGNALDAKRIAGRVELTAPIAGGGTPPDTGSAFLDVQGHWAQAYIEALAKQQIVTGFPGGTFEPDSPVTRAQFAALINKAFAPAPRLSALNFSDVSGDFWGFAAIQTAARGGFMRGYDDGSFRPNLRIPRVQVLVALANGLGLPAANSSVLARFQDASQIPSWATNSVSAATQRRLVVNYPNLPLLNPSREATRAEVAAFIYQALVDAGRLPAIASPYVVNP